MMDTDKVIGEVAQRHKVLLDPDDPVLVMATVCARPTYLWRRAIGQCPPDPGAAPRLTCCANPQCRLRAHARRQWF